MPAALAANESGASARTKINEAFAELANKLGIDLATAITATKLLPVGADSIFVADSEAAGEIKEVLLSSLGPVVRDVLAALAGEARLDAAAIKNLPSGGGAALGLWDYWYDWFIGNTSLPSGDMFQGAAIASGTNTAVPSNTLAVGYNSYGALLSSIASANTGWRYYASNGNEYFGAGGAKKFRHQWTPATDSATILVRGGWHNSINQTDAADGVYYEINNLTLSFKTAENSVRTTHGTTYTATLGVPLTIDGDVSAGGLEKRLRVYAGTSTTAVMDVTISDSRLTDGARRTGAAFVAVNTAAAAAPLGILHRLSVGTLAAFNKRYA